MTLNEEGFFVPFEEEKKVLDKTLSIADRLSQSLRKGEPLSYESRFSS
ncbi:hypothetical protein [Gracilibacillus phocaeensis]|nr:hypothetical protein [Gracilibacillus phocaeensis]